MSAESCMYRRDLSKGSVETTN